MLRDQTVYNQIKTGKINPVDTKGHLSKTEIKMKELKHGVKDVLRLLDQEKAFLHHLKNKHKKLDQEESSEYEESPSPTHSPKKLKNYRRESIKKKKDQKSQMDSFNLRSLSKKSSPDRRLPEDINFSNALERDSRAFSFSEWTHKKSNPQPAQHK